MIRAVALPLLIVTGGCSSRGDGFNYGHQIVKYCGAVRC